MLFPCLHHLHVDVFSSSAVCSARRDAFKDRDVCVHHSCVFIHFLSLSFCSVNIFSSSFSFGRSIFQHFFPSPSIFKCCHLPPPSTCSLSFSSSSPLLFISFFLHTLTRHLSLQRSLFSFHDQHILSSTFISSSSVFFGPSSPLSSLFFSFQ